MNTGYKTVATYDFRENPPKEGEEHPGYHVVLVNRRAYTLKDLAGDAERRSTLAESDMCHAVMDIACFLESHLPLGSVHIDGLGSFSLKVKGPKAAKPDENVGRAIEVSGIRFRPDASLLAALRSSVTFHRSSSSRTFARLPDDTSQVEMLRDHFSKERFILLRDLQGMLNCGRTKAAQVCKKLVDTGYLERKGTPYRPIYIAGPALTT